MEYRADHSLVLNQYDHSYFLISLGVQEQIQRRKNLHPRAREMKAIVGKSWEISREVRIEIRKWENEWQNQKAWKFETSPRCIEWASSGENKGTVISEVRGRVYDAEIFLSRNIVFAFSAEKVALGRKGVFCLFFFSYSFWQAIKGEEPHSLLE